MVGPPSLHGVRSRETPSSPNQSQLPLSSFSFLMLPLFSGEGTATTQYALTVPTLSGLSGLRQHLSHSAAPALFSDLSLTLLRG